MNIHQKRFWATILVLVLGWLLFLLAVYLEPKANADPLRCRDLPGPFGETSHICQMPDGTVTNCIVGPLPVMGPPCSPVYTQLAPGFWNN
jgi:hypothetical protein